MTIKLLTPRDLTIGGRTVTYPAGALVTLDAATETGLINSKEATATLTGGIAYTPPVPSGQPVPLTVIPSDQEVGDILAGDTLLSIPVIKSFPDFSPSILASFVAGTTASQSGTTVTVNAPAHGIVGSNARNGYRIYYPGSASIPAGWYPGFVWVDANTITFQRVTAATVASESVNGGAVYTAVTTFFTITLPGRSLGQRGRCRISLRRIGDATSASKVVRVILPGGVTIGYWLLTTQSFSFGGMTFFNKDSESVQAAVPNVDGGSHFSEYGATVNTTFDQPVSVAGNVSAAGAWLGIDFAEMEIVKR